MKDQKEVVWEGDSLEELKKFPTDVKVNIGGDLRRLQEDESPLDSKSLASIDRGVYELRARDKDGFYRVIYYVKIKDRIHVLHSFKKKTNATAKKDINKAVQRLKNLKQRLNEEKLK